MFASDRVFKQLSKIACKLSELLPYSASNCKKSNCCPLKPELGFNLNFNKELFMLSLKNIQPFTEFKAKTAQLLGQLKEQKSSIVLTVNGKAECMILDPESYERLQALKAENERLKLEILRVAVRPAIEAANRGELVKKPMREILSEIRQETRSQTRYNGFYVSLLKPLQNLCNT